MKRRTLLQLLATFGTAYAVRGKAVDIADPIPDEQQTALHLLCDLIIPDTDTPGAIKAGVLERFNVLFAYMDKSSQALWLQELNSITRALDQAAKAVFVTQSRDQQVAVLTTFDANAYRENSPEHDSYRRFKKAIGMAYYSTEIGATQELRYLPVPGNWKACVPFDDIGRTWAIRR